MHPRPRPRPRRPAAPPVQARLNHKLFNIEERRKDHLEREERRWKQMDDDIAEDNQRGARLAGTSKRNVGNSGLGHRASATRQGQGPRRGVGSAGQTRGARRGGWPRESVTWTRGSSRRSGVIGLAPPDPHGLR